MKDTIKQIVIIVGFFAIVFAFIFMLSSKNTNITENINKLEGFQSMEKLSSFSGCELPIDKNFDTFAKCLTEKGAVMYGAVWCAHCKDQKNAFGDSFQYIKYVECPENTELCLNEGIDGYPTWLIK